MKTITIVKQAAIVVALGMAFSAHAQLLGRGGPVGGSLGGMIGGAGNMGGNMGGRMGGIDMTRGGAIATPAAMAMPAAAWWAA